MRVSYLAVSVSLIALAAFPGESRADGLFQRWRSKPSHDCCPLEVGLECETPVQLMDAPLPPAPPGMRWETVIEQRTVPVQRPVIRRGRVVGVETVMVTQEVRTNRLVDDQVSGQLGKLTEGIEEIRKRLGTVQTDNETVRQELKTVNKKLDGIIEKLPKTAGSS